MKKNLFICLLALSHIVEAQTPQEVENITAFSRLYGYVRYFHPSDEAASIDWNQFAIHGSREVLECKDVECLQKTLIELFEPIAPTVRIALGEENEFSSMTVTPPDTTGYKFVSWQHIGLGNGMPRNIYQSGRTNRPTPTAHTFATITASIPVDQYRGRKFQFSARVILQEGPGTAHLWARIDRPRRTPGFFDNMDDRPIASKEWNLYRIAGTVNEDALTVAFGCFLQGRGRLMVDNLLLEIDDGERWKTIYSNSFESDSLNIFPGSMSGSRQPEYKTTVTADEFTVGNRIVTIESTDHSTMYKPLFAKHSEPGEYIRKNLGGGLSAIVPLTLYGNTENTWPAGDKEKILTLQRSLENVPTSANENLSVRTAGIIIAWNVFQHFYPYFDVVKADWNMAFKTAITEAFTDSSATEYLQTLRRLIAKLKDGHANVFSAEARTNEGYAPPISLEWIENKLVITNVGNDQLPLKVGDIVTTIDNIPAEKYFDGIYRHISAATRGWLHSRANSSSLLGPANSTLTIKVLDAQNKENQVALTRTLTIRDFSQLGEDSKQPIRTLKDGILYIDITKAPKEQIKDRFSDLENAKAIICDLRGYPKNNHEIISHFLHSNDTSQRWMRVPQVIYPDQQDIAGYVEMGWGLKAKEPHFGAKVFFLLDGSAISYAESFMGFIEHYDLATIVGQPSAGTNGNVNRFELPGGYSISWTGMKVFKQDGSPLHGVGILPDVYVEKTIRGVRENKDEFLEKAIDLATETLSQSK